MESLSCVPFLDGTLDEAPAVPYDFNNPPPAREIDEVSSGVNKKLAALHVE